MDQPQQPEVATLFTLEGSHLGLTGQKLTVFPTNLKFKKVSDHPLVEIVTSIDASVNKLRDIRSLGDFTQLKNVVLDHNELFEDSLVDLPIQDLERFIDNVKRVFPNLKSLSLTRNPCSPNSFIDEQKDRYQQFRDYVVSRLPLLEYLDGASVTDAERETAATSSTLTAPPISPRALLSPLARTNVGFSSILEGELTLQKRINEFTEWNPYYFKLGEGSLVYFQNSKSGKPLGAIDLKGCKVETVDDIQLLESVPQGMELFCLSHPNRKPVYLIAKNAEDLGHWMEALVRQLLNVDNVEDWDTMEARKTEMKITADMLKKRTSEIRLKKTINLANAIDPQEIKLDRVLGTGSYGTVYQGSVRSTPVAIKVLHHQDISSEAYDDFVSELEIMTKLHHPNIIRFMGATSQPLMIVTELMQGDLEHLLLDKSVKLTLASRFSMARDAALGIAWLHGSDPMIIHRDIKTSNFLYDEYYRVVVSDFGLAEHLRKGATTWDESGAFKGTLFYVAPELFKNSEFNETADVYAFGMVLWMIYTREPLFGAFEREHGNLPEAEFDDLVRHKVCFENFRPEIPSHCPPSLSSLMRECWDADPSKRPSFQNIVARLDAAYFEEAIRDTAARSLWIASFPGKLYAKFDKIIEKFSGFFMFESANDRRLLKELMSARQPVRGAPSAGESCDIVSADSFGRFIERFGPLSKSHDIVANSRRVASQKYFFGELNAREAHARLVDTEDGTFLVRFSSTNPSAYTISYVTRSSIRHYHVNRVVRFGRNHDIFEVDFILDKDGEKSSFLSLESCIRRQQAILTKPVPGHSFLYLQDRVTFKWKGQENDTNTPPNSPPRVERDMLSSSAELSAGVSSPAALSRRAAFAKERSMTMAHI